MPEDEIVEEITTEVVETTEEDIEKYAIRDTIIFKSVGKCSVWGDFASQLSVEAVVEVVE